MTDYDYKELVSDLEYYAERQGLWADIQPELIKAAADGIKQLTKERDAAIEELRSVSNNCRFCKWYIKRPYGGENCICPVPCMVDGNPDRWEWRGKAND